MILVLVVAGLGTLTIILSYTDLRPLRTCFLLLKTFDKENKFAINFSATNFNVLIYIFRHNFSRSEAPLLINLATVDSILSRIYLIQQEEKCMSLQFIHSPTRFFSQPGQTVCVVKAYRRNVIECIGSTKNCLYYEIDDDDDSKENDNDGDDYDFF